MSALRVEPLSACDQCGSSLSIEACPVDPRTGDTSCPWCDVERHREGTGVRREHQPPEDLGASLTEINGRIYRFLYYTSEEDGILYSAEEGSVLEDRAGGGSCFYPLGRTVWKGYPDLRALVSILEKRRGVE